jgi:hydroxypyruvate reductase/glycerate 2-kinase
MKTAQIVAEQIFRAALRQAAPDEAVRRETQRIRALYRDGGFRRLLTIGFGKASPSMAAAFAESLGDLIDSGLVITKYGHSLAAAAGRIAVCEAGHPVPDSNGLRASEELIGLVRAADERTLIVTLISGGGSALLVAPQAGISLADKQQTTSLLLRAGADIGELNTVRKHLSRVKGGRLAEAAFPATVVSLILSDVIGDRLDVIASGPTAADPTTYGEALQICERYRLSEKVPPPVMALLRRGNRGDLPETPKAGSPFLDRVENSIIGSNRQALEAAVRAAREHGLTDAILSAELTGEAREVGRQLARQALTEAGSKNGNSRRCLLAGGETTVTVRGSGKGGRNMELALAFAIEIEGRPGITLLSAGTDGTDGPTDAAGAIVDGETVVRARKQGLDPREYLNNNDSYTFFRRCGGLLVSGATGTNVMDLQIVLID